MAKRNITELSVIPKAGTLEDCNTNITLTGVFSVMGNIENGPYPGDSATWHRGGEHATLIQTLHTQIFIAPDQHSIWARSPVYRQGDWASGWTQII